MRKYQKSQKSTSRRPLDLFLPSNSSLMLAPSRFSSRNTRSSAASCHRRRRQILHSSRWSSLRLTTSSPSLASGISSASCANSRRQPVRLSQSSASTRAHRRRSRISAFGCVMTRARVHTTCTVSTVTWPLEVQSLSAMVTWPRATELVLTRSRWGFCFLQCVKCSHWLNIFPQKFLSVDHQNREGHRQQDPQKSHSAIPRFEDPLPIGAKISPQALSSDVLSQPPNHPLQLNTIFLVAKACEFHIFCVDLSKIRWTSK